MFIALYPGWLTDWFERRFELERSRWHTFVAAVVSVGILVVAIELVQQVDPKAAFLYPTTIGVALLGLVFRAISGAIDTYL